jgi:hypothetical protein
MTPEEIAAIVAALRARNVAAPEPPAPPKMPRWRAAGRIYENDRP